MSVEPEHLSDHLVRLVSVFLVQAAQLILVGQSMQPEMVVKRLPKPQPAKLVPAPQLEKVVVCLLLKLQLPFHDRHVFLIV